MSEGEISILQTCRACLSLSEDLCLISATIPESGISAETMFNYFLIEVDNLPKTICFSCLKQLQAAYTFFNTYKKSQEVLCQHFVEQKVMISNDQQDAGNSDVFENCEDLFSNDDEESESFFITNDLNSGNQAEDSDDENYLIAQSVKLTEQSKLQRFDSTENVNNESDDNSQEIDDHDEGSHMEVKNVELKPSKQASLHLLPCPLCSKAFKRFGSLTDHILIHSGETVICQTCLAQFDDVDLYIEHYRLHHLYRCTICHRAFSRIETYNKHLQVHAKKVPRFVCPAENCSKIFCVKNSLESHFLTVHSEKRNFLCSLCGASFKNYDNHRYHMKKHNGPSHLCMYCGKAYFQAGHLKHHMWRHTGLKPYKCTKCEKRFVSRYQLTKHVQKNCATRKRRGINLNT